mgnify:CR=1 FL=1
MWYNRDMRITGFAYLLFTGLLIAGWFVDLQYISLITRELYEANGAGIILLLSALGYVGLRLIKDKKISGIRRQLIGFVFYLSLLGVFQSLGIFAGILGVFVLSLFSGVTKLALFFAIPVLFYILANLKEKQNFQVRLARTRAKRKQEEQAYIERRIEPVNSKKEAREEAKRAKESRAFMDTLLTPKTGSRKTSKNYVLPSVDLLEEK